MTLNFDPRPACARLIQARTERRQFDALAAAERPSTLEQGYAVQQAVHASSGSVVAGYKVAAANAAALRTSEFGLALFGSLEQTAMHANDAVITRVEGARFTLEVEAAFELLCDVRAGDEPLDMGRLLSAPFLAIEIVCSRYLDRKTVGAPSFVADNSAFHAFVRGDQLDATVPDNAPWGKPAQLDCDGVSISHPLTGDACTEPLQSLALFWEHAAKYGLELTRGQVITTGTLVQPVDVDAPGVYEGRLGGARVGFTLV